MEFSHDSHVIPEYWYVTCGVFLHLFMFLHLVLSRCGILLPQYYIVYYESMKREVKTRPSPSKFVYYESMKRELKTRPIYECRCDERQKTKPEESTCLTYTGLLGELEHLKIETRLKDEMLASVYGSFLNSVLFIMNR
jgi:hypothetical protein